MRLRRYAPSDFSTYLKYASGGPGRKPCIHIRLDLLATNPCEKCGLAERLNERKFFLWVLAVLVVQNAVPIIHRVAIETDLNQYQ